MSQLTHFRDEIDNFMEMHPQSPLPAAARDTFDGLAYYDPDPALEITADLDYFPADEPHVELTTTTGDTRHYRKLARFSFDIDGDEATLVVYSDPWGESLFVPFKDATNGSETYGAGRYLDDHRPAVSVYGETITVDFNYAYNPYCAYNEAYSCPLPPRENWLSVPIRAGEKVFKTAVS